MKIINICEKDSTKGIEGVLKGLKEIGCNESFKPIDFDLLDIEKVSSGEDSVEKIKDYFKSNNRFIFLDDSYFVNFSLAKGFLESCKLRGKELCIIVFDSGLGIFSCEKWIKKLVEEGFNAQNILVVGARDFVKDEILFMKETGIRFMGCNKLLVDIEDATDIITEFSSGKELFVFCGLSVLDGKHSFGGISSRQLLYIVERLKKSRNLRALSLFGFNDKISEIVGAKVLAEFL